jgi:hypothetical protein
MHNDTTTKLLNQNRMSYIVGFIFGCVAMYTFLNTINKIK